MRVTAADQHELGVVDIVVPEPGEGAHTDPRETARRLRAVIVETLARLDLEPVDALVERRYRRYRAFGAYTEIQAPRAAPPERPGIADRLRNLVAPGRWPLSPPALPGALRRDDPPAREEV
jgi:hypothetical protein